MAEPAREIELRAGKRTWATLRIEPNGDKILCHQLREAELEFCPPLLPYEGTSQLKCNLAVREQGPCVEFVDARGNLKLRLLEGDDGELIEVADPRGDAQLTVELEGAGSVASQPIQEGWLALKLCRVKSDPKIMMGKPVIRGTRITVEFLLRRLGGGATEDELLSDYPQLTRNDIREALDYAAKILRTSRPSPKSLETRAKG